MLEAHRAELLRRVPGDARVLDVGGWASPLSRADWVIDLMPYASRGLYGADPDPERFTADSWVQRDVCTHEPWPFADGAFDFVVCSHTLEDVRDPLRVVEEIARVGRAGYVEFPSRLVEQAWGVEGPWVGYSHHHWLCEADRAASALRFTFKPHALHAPPRHFPAGFAQRLTAEQRVDWLWWEGAVTASERVHLGAESLEADLRGFVDAHAGDVPPAPRPTLRARLRRS
jgi:SAM-dependent methyltransferase